MGVVITFLTGWLVRAVVVQDHQEGDGTVPETGSVSPTTLSDSMVRP
jgi:hypothetical protein